LAAEIPVAGRRLLFQCRRFRADRGRKIRLIQASDIKRFVAEGLELDDGSVRKADLVVLATGYKGLDHLLGTLFGAEIANRVGRIWGFDEKTQELRNMWVRTGQPCLWFTGGRFCNAASIAATSPCRSMPSKRASFRNSQAAAQRSSRKNCWISAASAAGCSMAAKWPPFLITVQRWMLV
jgi:cation diffusion facilitator CzcD-associated flavoprotein CzcO